jgi:hypothetical protein
MRTTESTHLQGSPDAKVKTTDGEAFACNHSDARSSRPDALQQNIGFAVARPDYQNPVRKPPSRNPNLSKIRIYEAYLKGFLGIVSLRIPK